MYIFQPLNLETHTGFKRLHLVCLCLLCAERLFGCLETAIVLIAFVVVASVFSFTVLSAGVFSSEANKQTIFAGPRETRTRLRQNGSTFAFSAKVASTDAVYKLVFVVSNSAMISGIVEAVDSTGLVMSWSPSER